MGVFCGPAGPDNCPRCGDVLACGWWCRQCKMTKDYAQEVVNMRELFEPTWGDLIVPVGVVLILLLSAVVCFGVGAYQWVSE